jgi:hypothetical protein
MTRPTLLSFNLCPYVQRSVITFEEKAVPYDIEYVDLYAKPDWFLKLSLLGATRFWPVLQSRSRCSPTARIFLLSMSKADEALHTTQTPHGSEHSPFSGSIRSLGWIMS